MSKEKLEQEVREAAEAMQRAAAKIGEQATALNSANGEVANLKTQVSDLQSKLAAGGAVSTEELDSLANTLDGAQTALDAAVNATTAAQEATTEAATTAENVDTSTVTDAAQG